MSALRQLLRRPEAYLIALLVAVGLLVAEAYQAPARQVSSRVYVAGVHAYQALGRPTVRRVRACKTDIPLGTFDPVPEVLE